ncbi:MAG: GIY-YIG nuclease family protein [Pseudomonadota bacterium]
MKPGYVYLLTNRPSGVLYLGVTDDLSRRIGQHRSGAVAGFARKYNCKRLVWFTRFDNLHDARQLEHRMKSWRRAWKIEKIEELNPAWADLFEQGPVL